MDGLPPQSRTRTALRDGNAEPTGEQIILADLFDAVSIADWHFVAANTEEKKAKPRPPKRYPRWWEPDGRPAASGKASPERVAKIEDARRRQKARREAIAQGAIA